MAITHQGCFDASAAADVQSGLNTLQTNITNVSNVLGTAVAAATTISAPSNFFHVTGNTAIATMNLPPNLVGGGPVTIVFDGTATWTSAGNFATTGANTTANTAVMFYYDSVTTKWYPSRMA